MRSHRQGSSSRETNGVHHKASRASLGTNRSLAHSLASQDSSVAYGQAVIVGKLEFDIDRGRGGGKWFDNWLESANTLSRSKPLFPRGGTRHPDSQLETLMRSRNISKDPASPRSLQMSHDADPASTTQSSRQPSPSAGLQSRLSPSLSKDASRNDLAADHGVPGSSAIMALAGSQRSMLSAQSDRQSVASSSIGPVLDDGHRLSLALSASSSTYAVEDRAVASSSSLARAGSRTSSRQSRMSSRGDSSQDLQSQQSEHPDMTGERAVSRQSIRSVASTSSSRRQASVGDVHCDLMNATPRVRPPQVFQQRAQSPPEEDHESSPSPLATRPASQSPRALPERADSESIEEPQIPPVKSSCASGSSRELRYRQQSDISARSGASSASFEAVSEDGSQQLQSEAAYEALPDETEEESSPTQQAEVWGEFKRISSPSDAFDCGRTSGQGDQLASEAALVTDPLKDVFGSDALTWSEIRAGQPQERYAAAELPAVQPPDFTSPSGGPSPSTGLGILSPPLHPMTIPPSASSASFDPFEYDNEGRSSTPPDAAGEDADVEEVIGLLKTQSMSKVDGLSSPINLGEPKAVVMAAESDGEKPQEGDTGNDFVAAIDERRTSVNHSRAASIASSSYSRRAHSRKSSSISSLRHVRHDSTASNGKKPPLLPIPSPTPAGISLPESDSAYSLASTSHSFPSLSKHANDYIAPLRGGNRTAGLPEDWVHQLSAFPGLRSRANTDVSALPSTDVAVDEAVIIAVDADDEEPHKTLGATGTGKEQSAFLTPNNARDSYSSLAEPEVSRSRSSSVEMAEGLDDLERALLELSPRAAKNARQEPVRALYFGRRS